MADLGSITAVRPTQDTVKSDVVYGATVAVGDSVYKDTADNDEWKLADADSSAITAGSGGIGVAMTAGVDGGYGIVATGGSIILVGTTMAVDLACCWRDKIGSTNLTYGFAKHKAKALDAQIGIEDTEYPEGRVRGNGTGVTFWRFTLNEAWSSGVADADILEMDGTDTTTDADVNDPLGIFADLGSGDAGICFLQGGAYWAIQAPCPA